MYKRLRARIRPTAVAAGLLLAVACSRGTAETAAPPPCGASAVPRLCDASCYREDGSLNPHKVCKQIEQTCGCVPRLTPCGDGAVALKCDAACLRQDGSVDPTMACRSVGDSCKCEPVAKEVPCSDAKAPACESRCRRADGSPDPDRKCEHFWGRCRCVPGEKPGR
jgi:hypothetical protein